MKENMLALILPLCVPTICIQDSLHPLRRPLYPNSLLRHLLPLHHRLLE